MIKRINHVAIVVKNLDEALKLYESLFDAKATRIETIQEQGVKAALIPLGDSGEIELLEPIDSNSGLAKFLANKGEGIHHVCLEVDNIDRVLNTLAEQGVKLIDKKGRQGLVGQIGFIHPKSTKGVLIELAQTNDKSQQSPFLL